MKKEEKRKNRKEGTEKRRTEEQEERAGQKKDTTRWRIFIWRDDGDGDLACRHGVAAIMFLCINVCGVIQSASCSDDADGKRPSRQHVWRDSRGVENFMAISRINIQ